MRKSAEFDKFCDNLWNGRLTRRQVSQALLSVGIGMSVLPLAPTRGRAQGKHPIVFEWSGYELPEFHQAYIDRHGASPEFTFFGEEEEALQKMRAGYKPDIAHPCTYSTARWRDAGILKPVDTSRIEAWDTVFPSLKDLPGSHDAEGKNYFVPWDWGNSSVLYRTDLVDPEYIEEESWEILFDERYKGRLAIYDSVDGVMGVVGLIIGAENPFDMTDEELERARELMSKQRDLLRFYWTDNTAVEQALASGELVASYAWNNSYVALQDQGLPVAYMIPKEGIYTWVCGLSIIEGGEGDEDLIYDFLNAMLTPEAGAYLIDAYGIGHANAKSFDLVAAERLAALGIKDPVSHMEGAKYFEEIPPAVREKYIQVFEEVKAGL